VRTATGPRAKRRKNPRLGNTLYCVDKRVMEIKTITRLLMKRRNII